MAQQQAKGAIQVDLKGLSQVRHPLKAATLLYSAPSFVLRGPIYMVFIIMIVGMVYSFWAKKDVLVNASLALERESTTVQAVGSGMVYDIMTANNSAIRAGDPMIVIQEQIRAAANPEQNKLLGQIQDLEEQLKNARRDYEHKINQLQLDLEDTGKSRGANLTSAQAKIDQLQHQKGSAADSVQSIARKLELARKRLNQQEELFRNRDITITEVENAREAVADLESKMADARREVDNIQLSLLTAVEEKRKIETLHSTERLQREIEQAKANRDTDIKDLQDKIASLEKKAGEMDTLVQGVSYAGNLARYKSNFDGVISEVHVKRGELVSEGIPLVTIVKDTAALNGRVLIPNKDIGNIKHGQEVKIKYFAYPYQEYGIQKAVISEIGTKPSGEPGKESMYTIKVALERETIKARNGVEKKLEIGLEGFVEIKTGEKRLIELLFSPVSKFFDGKEE